MFPVCFGTTYVEQFFDQKGKDIPKTYKDLWTYFHVSSETLRHFISFEKEFQDGRAIEKQTILVGN